MYSNQSKTEAIIPNYYQLDQLPFVKIQQLNLQVNLSAKRMLCVRNLTHKFETLMCKMFAFWPKFEPKSNKQQQGMQKIALVLQLPVMSLQNLTYIAAQLHNNNRLSQQDWNSIITLIQQFKQQSGHIIDSLMMIQNQIKMANHRNVWHNVYYSVSEDCFRLKVSFKTLNYQVSPFLKKNKLLCDLKEGFIIKNQALIAALKLKLEQKLALCKNINFEKTVIDKQMKKIQQFYERDLKKIDQNLLQLKLKFNYPLLRQKRYIPIQFVDGGDNQKLVEPIISNKNKHCMYGHFTGYNSSNFTRLQRTYCQYCGIEIKQMQENKLLMFLRDNIFNPANNSILYCPQFNRFKTYTKISEVELTKRKIAQLRIDDQKKNQIEEQGQMRQQSSQMNNQQVNNEQVSQSQIGFINYMHLCLTVKNMYTLTKNRIKIEYKKQLQIVNYVYPLLVNSQALNNDGKSRMTTNPYSKKIKQYFLPFELTDPARGKFCNHLQFADLRLYYLNSKKKSNYVFNENIYICPICGQEVRDSELIYLKEVLVLLKYIRRLLEPNNQYQMESDSKNQKKIIKDTIRITINNVQKRVFLQYRAQYKNSIKQQWIQIQKFYSTLVDPYIPFSQHSLGLRKRNKRLDALYNFQNNDNENGSDNQRLEKKWLGLQENNFTV